MADLSPFLILRAATRLVDGIQEGMAARGFDDVRPAHGFAFVLIAGGGSTVAELAEHLGVTKQAASQMVQHLESRGYVTRAPHPDDARAKLVVLTERGRACTAAATEAGDETLGPWLAGLDRRTTRDLAAALGDFAGVGPLRPAW
jgi:DNA-binding MarR family transcriptional regulator